MQNQTAAQSYRDAGCTEYEILTASDRRTCRRCAAQNGKRYLLANMQAGENAPPFHPNCRCTVLPVVGEEERLAKKAGQELGFAVAKTGESGIIVPKADGVLDLETGVRYQLAKGSKLQDVEIFAGKGSKKEFRQAEKYAQRYGGAASNWQHAKGKGMLATDEGDIKAEIHWVQCEGIGKKEMFVKKWLE